MFGRKWSSARWPRGTRNSSMKCSWSSSIIDSTWSILKPRYLPVHVNYGSNNFMAPCLFLFFFQSHNDVRPSATEYGVDDDLCLSDRFYPRTEAVLNTTYICICLGPRCGIVRLPSSCVCKYTRISRNWSRFFFRTRRKVLGGTKLAIRARTTEHSVCVKWCVGREEEGLFLWAMEHDS